jgi:SAM-dependent methyltransferase
VHLSGIFQTYGKYYDLIYEDKDYEKECCYIEDIFSHFSKSKPRRVLDIGCGTGGHAILLAKRGYDVIGVDISQTMINIAKKKAKSVSGEGCASFHIMDMKRLKLNQMFDACICMFSSIDYLLTYEDLRRTLRNVRMHLTKDSLFIFDFWNGLAVLTITPSARTKIIDKGAERFIRITVPRLDAMHHLCQVTYHCIVIRKGRVVDEFKENHVVRFFFPKEMEHYLEENGFTFLRMCPFLSVKGRADEKTWHLTAISQAK